MLVSEEYIISISSLSVCGTQVYKGHECLMSCDR